MSGGCLSKGSAKSFKDRLENMMGVVAIGHLYMQGHAAVQGKSAEEFLDKSGIECAHLLVALHHMIVEIRPVGEIDGDPGQGYIHGQCAMTVTVDCTKVAESCFEGLAGQIPTSSTV